MKINILIGGDAGQGINELSNILSRMFVKHGFYVFNYRNYRSLITGAHNFNILSVSDKPILSHDWKCDIVLALDDDTFKLHEDKLKKDTLIIHNQKEQQNKDDEKNIFLDTTEYKKVENMYFAGTLFKILGLNKNYLLDDVKETFAGKSLLDKDIEVINKAHSQNYKTKISLPKDETSEKIKLTHLTGADAVGIGAIESGLDVYFAYPMTPSTSLLNHLAEHQKKYGYFVFSPESEIAVVNAALGASFKGSKTMIGTAGGGFDLMTEAISMQGQSELPLIVYLASRSGPSSGTPTFTGQEDLNLALYGGHGDFPRIVFAPGDIKEAYESTKQAFYLSERYGSLSIILTDKHHAESGYTQELKYYDLYTKKSKRPFKANSYSHDLQGNYTEDPKTIELATKNRNLKLEQIKKELDTNNKIKTYSIHGDENAKKLIIGFGSTKGPILDAVNSGKLKDYRYIHVICVQPFTNKLKKEILKHKDKDIIVIENNSTGQFADQIQKNTPLEIPMSNRILKYDTQPFTSEDIIKLLTK